MKKNLKAKAEKKKVFNVVGKWLCNNVACVLCLMLFVLMSTGVVGASPTNAEAMWNAVMGLIETWVTRLGLVVLLVGGIMFGLGFKNDDAEGKTRGVNVMIAGGIVTAVVGLVSYLMI